MATTTNERPIAQKGRLGKVRNVHKRKATWATPQSAGSASQAVWRKKRRLADMHGSLLGLPSRGNPAANCIPYKTGPCGLSRESASANMHVCGTVETERAGFDLALA